jgi:hypothetical protein
MFPYCSSTLMQVMFYFNAKLCTGCLVGKDKVNPANFSIVPNFSINVEIWLHEFAEFYA